MIFAVPLVGTTRDAIPDRSCFAHPNKLMEFVNATRAPCQLQLQFTAARRR